eukprot:TRINITY_DN7666_c0_g1_i1.p1 TRINITY_DN7666_c0_g1~~TRINITY_DN7666_c0_g1_i1.p1  ORF type:complete len:202 (+),score=27.47 TRINITY_DN7666_c0_g1_i1:134-739(+)
MMLCVCNFDYLGVDEVFISLIVDCLVCQLRSELNEGSSYFFEGCVPFLIVKLVLEGLRDDVFRCLCVILDWGSRSDVAYIRYLIKEELDLSKCMVTLQALSQIKYKEPLPPSWITLCFERELNSSISTAKIEFDLLLQEKYCPKCEKYIKRIDMEEYTCKHHPGRYTAGYSPGWSCCFQRLKKSIGCITDDKRNHKSLFRQ